MSRKLSKTAQPRTRLPGREFEVSVTRQPVTRCDLCGQPVTYLPGPGNAAAALTAHYAAQGHLIPSPS